MQNFNQGLSAGSAKADRGTCIGMTDEQQAVMSGIGNDLDHLEVRLSAILSGPQPPADATATDREAGGCELHDELLRGRDHLLAIRRRLESLTSRIRL